MCPSYYRAITFNRLLFVVTAEEAALCAVAGLSPVSPEGQAAGKGGVGGDQAGHAPCRAVPGAPSSSQGGGRGPAYAARAARHIRTALQYGTMDPHFFHERTIASSPHTNAHPVICDVFVQLSR